MGLVGGGLALWLPECGGPSSANSDLGLALLGGGLALTAGYLVSRAVFVAQARVDRELRRAEELRERDNQRVRLSMTKDVRGADLRDADLGDVILRHKDLRDATSVSARARGTRGGAVLLVRVDAHRCS